jgi:phosphomannomutase
MTAAQKAGLPCIKAYDIRGRIPDELNEDLAYQIGKAYATLVFPSKVCLGRDVRLSSEAMLKAVAAGLNSMGCDVMDIGLCPTEQIYFTTSHFKLDGGIMVTASHNPMDYNGMKMVREEARPISGDTGLKDIERMVLAKEFGRETGGGIIETRDTSGVYVDHVLSYVNPKKVRELKIVANCGNGCADPILRKMRNGLPALDLIKLFPEPDGSFPNGIPNPILRENRDVTSQAVVEHKADMGIAWDGDCDRCFFFDEKGNFIEGYYLVGFLAQAFLKYYPGAKIIHDPRLTWNTIEMVRAAGGVPVQCKAGHAFIKERMRDEDAVYGGEMSAHHYFKDFAYCDSGMIPWLLIAETLSEDDKPFSELIKARIEKYPVSGEINRKVSDAPAAINRLEEEYMALGPVLVDHTDGLSVEFENWRFNLRASNTEPVIRLNVETRQDRGLLLEKTDEILRFIESMG